MFQQIITGLFSFQTLIALIVGVCGGTIIGCLPGLSASMGVALLLPMTYSMDTIPAMVMLTAIYTCAIYGGSISAILIHTPGTPSSAATALDGYTMTLQGRGLQAVGFSTYSSMVGGVLSAIALFTISPALSLLSLKFSSAEYFFIAIFGLTIIASVAADNIVKGLAAGALGLVIACIGSDPLTGYARLTFGTQALQSGVNFVPALIGLFSVSQVMVTSETIFNQEKKEFASTKGRFWPTAKEMAMTMPTVIKSSIIGIFIGILPGAGGDIASWVAYNTAKNSSKEPETFGKGNPIGICASEAANNAVTGGSFIPLFTLGVPGSSTAAVILGGMMIHGLIPGNSLFTDQADKVYPIMIGFMIANVLMGIIGVLIGPTLTRLAGVPISSLAPILIVLCMIGAYTTNGNIYDVYIALAFGIVGYLMRRTGFTPTPIVLAVILGGMAENGFSQSLIMARGNVVGYYMSRPISCVLIVLTLAALLWPIYQWIRGKLKAKKA